LLQVESVDGVWRQNNGPIYLPALTAMSEKVNNLKMTEE
jgi:hypothetical protein